MIRHLATLFPCFIGLVTCYVDSSIFGPIFNTDASAPGFYRTAESDLEGYNRKLSKNEILRRDYQNLLSFIAEEIENASGSHHYLQYDIEAMQRRTRVVTLSKLLSQLPSASGKMHSGKMHSEKMHSEKMHSEKMHSGKMHSGKMHSEKMHSEKMHSGKMHSEKMHSGKMHSGKMHSEKMHSGKMHSGEKPYVKEPDIYVVNEDSFDAAIHILRSHQGGRVAVLNMANAEFPCGNVHLGPPAQEQELCRRSALAYSLMPRFNQKLWGDNSAYSIPDDGLIYSPDVPVFLPRKSMFPLAPLDFQNDIYTPVPKVDVISSAAVNVHSEGIANFSRRTETKIRAQVTAAVVKGVHHLVLGAFGCGAFGGDPQDVAQLYREVLKEYGNNFISVTFAIYEPTDRNSVKIKAFKKTFFVS